MNAIMKLRYQSKVGLLLGVLLLVLLLNNIASQHSFSRMQGDATSIYEDRLMASTFLFDIREALYEEQALLSSAAAGAPATAKALKAQRAVIAGLIQRYEKTRLTRDERAEWKALKTHLLHFHTATVLTPQHSAHLDKALRRLHTLNAIQAGEGRHLQNDLVRVGASSSLRTSLEFALVVLIGAITLSLIGSSRGIWEKTVSHRPSMN